MSRYMHTNRRSKQPPPPITTVDGATESLFIYLNRTITRSFTILDDLLTEHEYNTQSSQILASRSAYKRWVAAANLTDTSKRAEERLIAVAAPHVLERLVALLTDLDSTLYSAVYQIRKRQVDGRMAGWFVRDVQIALGRVEDFMDEWRGDEQGSGFGADDMRTPMPGDFFDAEDLSRGVVQDVEGREIAERIEAEERERAKREGDGGRGGYAREYGTYPDQQVYDQHNQQYAGGCQRGRHQPGCQHAHDHSNQHVYHHGHPQAHTHAHQHGHAHGHEFGPHGRKGCH